MSRLIDALHKDLRELYCKDCEYSSMFGCNQCNIPALLATIENYFATKEVNNDD